MTAHFASVVRGIDWFVLGYVLVVDTIYLVQLISAYFGLRNYIQACRYGDYRRYLNSENMVPISVIAPAHDEEEMIVDNVRSLLDLDFPLYEVVVVNDGSTDATLDRLIGEFDLQPCAIPYRKTLETEPIRGTYRSMAWPRLIVVDKENGGKADALNAGINASGYPIFVSMDADSILEKDSLIKIIMPFVKDSRVIGVGGIVRIANGCTIEGGHLRSIGLVRNPLVSLQVVEYLRAFLTGRIGFDNLGILLIISGAFGAFRKDAVLNVGGYTSDTVGEDMELVVKLHRYYMDAGKEYRIQFLSDPVCWTEAPAKLGEFWGQRKRWHIGLMDTLFRHRDMVFRRKYGRIGMVALPYYWVFEFFGSLIESLGYVIVLLSLAAGIIELRFAAVFFGIALFYGTSLSLGALILEENTFKKYPTARQLGALVFYAFVDNLGYRQLNAFAKAWAVVAYRRDRRRWS